MTAARARRTSTSLSTSSERFLPHMSRLAIEWDDAADNDYRQIERSLAFVGISDSRS